ncbi:MAG TPA: glycosyltransferase family A protein [Mycobacteriales bacterium]|nr:glycosyltransferase family A protein [Mycobacteriales bacterium]
MTGSPAAEQDTTGAGTYPAVTVVIPTRDRPQLVRKAVAAVLAQDYPGEVRCIVVHDSSEPDTELEEDRVAVTRNVRSPGLAGARNSGIALVETELVAFCDDDDRWLPDKLSAQVAVLRSDPEASFVCCGIQVRYGDRLVERTLSADRVTFTDLLRDRLTELHPSTFLIRRALLDEIGLVDEELPGSYAEDYELLLRAARVAPIRSLPSVHVEVLWHQKSYFTGRWATVSAALQRLLVTYPDFYGERAGAARLTGQIAFAEAALGNRRQALRWAAKTARLKPTEPRAVLALAVASKAVTGERVVRELNSRGRGI